MKPIKNIFIWPPVLRIKAENLDLKSYYLFVLSLISKINNNELIAVKSDVKKKVSGA
jgi:hypothetical protein